MGLSREQRIEVGRKALAVLMADFHDDDEGYELALAEFGSDAEIAAGYRAVLDLLIGMHGKVTGRSQYEVTAGLMKFFASGGNRPRR